MSSHGYKSKPSNSIDSRAVQIIGRITYETPKAALVETEDKWGKRLKVWLPKSQLKKPIEERKDGTCVMQFPVWLIEEKSIDYLEVEDEESEVEERTSYEDEEP